MSGSWCKTSEKTSAGPLQKCWILKTKISEAKNEGKNSSTDGTIKFEQPVTAKEDGTGYFCILKAEIEAYNMKNGSQVYSFTTTYEANGKNWNECVSKGNDKRIVIALKERKAIV